jgi:hypothetical protein
MWLRMHGVPTLLPTVKKKRDVAERFPHITEINPSVANRSRIDHKTALRSTSRGASARMLRSAWYSSKCLIEGDDRYVDVSLALGDCVLRLKLSALGI